MRTFIQRYLDPGSRLGEVVFGLIMALGFTGAVRLESEEPENRALFIGIFGCNLAWGIVDGVMYAAGMMFERGRRARLKRDIVSAPSDEIALRRIGEALDDPLWALTTEAERDQLHRSVLTILRRDEFPRPHLRADDILGGLAVTLLIMVATFPVVLPFLLVSNPHLAVRISNWTGLTELFLVGLWWGRAVGASPLWCALGVTAVGAALVIVTILLGG